MTTSLKAKYLNYEFEEKYLVNKRVEKESIKEKKKLRNFSTTCLYFYIHVA